MLDSHSEVMTSIGTTFHRIRYYRTSSQILVDGDPERTAEALKVLESDLGRESSNHDGICATLAEAGDDAASVKEKTTSSRIRVRMLQALRKKLLAERDLELLANGIEEELEGSNPDDTDPDRRFGHH